METISSSLPEKTCSRCNRLKPATEFHRNGKSHHCKPCASADNLDYIRRKRASDPDFYVKRKMRETQLGYVPKNLNAALTVKRHEQKFPEKAKAKNATKSLAKVEGVDRHHWSYNNAHLKDIIDMPSKIHRMAHRFLTYDPYFKWFRTEAGTPLPSKEEHVDYLVDVILRRILPVLKTSPFADEWVEKAGVWVEENSRTEMISFTTLPNL